MITLTDYLLLIDLLILILLDKACAKAVFLKFSLVPKASYDSFCAHGQQAITFDNPRENYYQFTHDNKVIGIDTGAAEEQSISLFVDEQFATQLALTGLRLSSKPHPL